MDYYDILKVIHQILVPASYLEIGVRNGISLALAPPRTWACGIDPKPEITAPISDNSHIYACTSDDFFERFPLSTTLPSPLDFAFIDGMHLFEYALRDFIHIEALSHKRSLIAIHDTFPDNALTAARERQTDKWCGDVFKLLLIFKKYRPDLELLHFDAEPSGLCLVKYLNPESTVLKDNYDAIIREFLDFDFRFVEEDKNRKLSAIQFTPIILRKFFNNIRNTTNTFHTLQSPVPPASRFFFSNRTKHKIKALGVLLCYNDADILGENIEYLLSQNHELIVWDHGSTDHTAEVLNKYDNYFIERRFIPRDVDFYVMYQLMSRRLIENYIKHYDVISWPDQDEFLEGPFRDRSYYEYILDFYDSPYNWIRFNNMNFWYSCSDDASIKATERIKHYSHFPDCSPRIRAWRAKVTNIRLFNHNPLAGGVPCPLFFNLRHYPCRSREQMIKRILVDRANIERERSNTHYNALKSRLHELESFDAAKLLHKDDGRELNRIPAYDWRKLYAPLS